MLKTAGHVLCLLLASIFVSSVWARTSPLAQDSANQDRDDQDMVIEVRAKKRQTPSRASSSKVEMTQNQIAKLPQGAEVSLPKLLATTTPGVVQGAFGQTFIRGNHGNVQYQVDGVQLPDSPSNSFGQIMSPRNIDRMELITGGIPAEFGQRLSAVVNITTRAGAEKGEGELELNYGTYNAYSPHLLYGGATESGNVRYFFSANYFHTDRGLDTPQPQGTALSDQFQGGSEAIHDTATGNNEFVRLDWQKDNENKISLILFHSASNFQIPTFPSSFKESDPFFQPGYTDAFGNTQGPTAPTFNFVPGNTDNTQAEINAYSQVVWKHTFSDRSFLQFAPYYKYSSMVITNDPKNDLFAKGVIPGAAPSSFSENRHVNHLGLKSDYTLRLSEQHLVKTGFQVQASRADGRISIQTDPGVAPFTDSTPNTGVFEGVYVQDDFRISRPLTLNAGLRFDATQFSIGDLHPTDSLLQPRVGLNYLITENTRFHIFYGKLFQPAPVESLRYQFNPTTGKFVSLSSYDIKAEKDDYYEAGILQKLGSAQELAVNGYYKDGVHVLDDFQILNTSIAQPYNFATGFAYGVEVSLRGQISPDWSEYLNYSYGIAMGQGIDSSVGESGPGYQFLDHLQKHTANAGITYAKNNFWWTGQILFGSGLGTGKFNSISLPAHFTSDTTVGYEFHGNSFWSKFRLSGDVLNILDNKYPITIANGFNGSHYAAGRQLIVRIIKEL